jgi:hypothetical protein
VWLIQLNELAPLLALVLVGTALMAGIGFWVGIRSTTWLRYVAVAWGPVPAVLAIFFSLHPKSDVLHRAVGANMSLHIWVSLEIGAQTFILGLLMVGGGTAVAVLGSLPHVGIQLLGPLRVADSRRVRIRRLALILAVPLVVLSFALPWYHVDSTTSGYLYYAQTATPGLEYWQTIYRIGLIIVILLLVANTVATSAGARGVFRTAGLFVASGLLFHLAMNALLIWTPRRVVDQMFIGMGSINSGPGYLIAVGGIATLLVLMTTLPSGTSPYTAPTPTTEVAAE